MILDEGAGPVAGHQRIQCHRGETLLEHVSLAQIRVSINKQIISSIT